MKGQKTVTEFRVMSFDERVSEKNNGTKQRKAEMKFECLEKKKKIRKEAKKRVIKKNEENGKA